MGRFNVWFMIATVVATVTTVTLGPAARADWITGVTVADYSSQYAPRPASNTTSGLGLVNGLLDDVDTHMWLTNLNLPVNDPSITFSLGNKYNLSSLHVWNYNEYGGGGFGAEDVTIWTSPDADNPTWTSHSATFAEAPGANNYAGEDILLNVSNVSLVKFQILDNWFGYTYPATTGQTAADGFHGAAGLGEVRFTGTPTPEPSMLTLSIIGGVALLAYAWRKRR